MNSSCLFKFIESNENLSHMKKQKRLISSYHVLLVALFLSAGISDSFAADPKQEL